MEENENKEVEKAEVKNETTAENKEKQKTKKKSEFCTKLAIFVVIILIIFVIIELFTEFFSKSFTKIRHDYLQEKGIIPAEGNTIGNIRNQGYVVTDDEYLYYMSPNEASTAIGIRRLKKDNLTGKPETLIQGNWEITGLNYMDGYIYFITFAEPEVIADSTEEIEDTVDNKIHRMRANGTEHTVINDNEFNNKNYEIYVIYDKVYYIGEDDNIYYMDLDGKNKTRLNDNKCGFIGITKDYIFYNKILPTENTADDELNFETHKMNLDGTNDQVILENGKIFNINVVGDYIYYVDQTRYLYRIKLDGTERKMLSDETAYSLNVSEDGIFYLNYYTINGITAGVGVYRMDLDGKNISQLATLDNYSENLGEFDNWLFFTDYNEEEGRFTLVSKDGNQTINLYKLVFSQFTKIGEDTADIVIPLDPENTDESEDQENN